MAAEQSVFAITESTIFKGQNSQNVEKATADLYVMSQENKVNYDFLQHVCVIDTNNTHSLRILNLLGKKIACKLVKDKVVKKATKPKTTEEKEQTEDNEDVEQQTPKKIGGYYLSMLDFCAGFDAAEKEVKSILNSLDKNNKKIKIVENTNWFHISALPALVLRFTEFDEYFAQTFNRLIFAQHFDDSVLDDSMFKNRTSPLSLEENKFTLKPKDAKPKEEGNEADKNKVILIIIHCDEATKNYYIELKSSKEETLEKNVKNAQKKGTTYAHHLNRADNGINGAMIVKYLTDVKKLEAVTSLDETKKPTPGVWGYIKYTNKKNLPATEEAALEIFDEFNDEYINSHIEASKSKKGGKTSKDGAAPVTHTKKNTTTKEETTKPVKSTKSIPKQTEQKPKASTKKGKEPQNTPVKQESSEEEEDLAFDL